MGNAGGFTSVGHSTDAGDANTSDHDAGEQQDGHQEYGGSKLSEKQLQQMARHFEVSKTEIQVLWQRFCVLGPGHEGVLDRSVFQRSPYSEDIFCRQIWKRFSGSKDEPDKISFQSFARSMIWWQKAPINHKLQLLFSWMKDVDGITPRILTNILKHIFSEYEEHELKQMAEKMMHSINPSSEPPIVKQDDFQHWMSQLPEEELRDALEFKILHIDTETHT